MKRFWICVLTLSLLAGALCLPSAAEEEPRLFTDGTLTYGLPERTTFPVFRSWFDRTVIAAGIDGRPLTDASLVGTGTQVYTSDGSLLCTVVLQGDVNGNGRIETNDAITARSILLDAGSVSLDGAGAQFAAADCNRNGRIDSNDFVMIRNHLLGITAIPARPVPEDASDPTISLCTVDASYRIVASSSDTAASGEAERLSASLLAEAGISLTLSDDGAVPAAKEIVIGAANRDGCAQISAALGENAWKIAARDDRIYIVGKTPRALQDGVDAFLATYVTGKETITVDRASTPEGVVGLYDFTWAEDGDPTVYGSWFTFGYPRLLTLQSGWSLLAVDGWAGNRGMTVFRAVDDCRAWGLPIDATPEHMGYSTANANLFQTEDGAVYLAYRATGAWDVAPFYTSIQVAVSYDDGETWQHHSTVYENTETDPARATKGVWEPHLGMMNGKLTCFYANDSTAVTWYQNIEYKQWDPQTSSWGNRTIVCNGNDHESRDGMPVWMQLSDGDYACVVEAYDTVNTGNFCIKLVWSADGVNWSEPVTVMSSTVRGRACAAPSMAELPNGQLVISCQSNERYGGENYRLTTCVSDGTRARYLTEANFGEHMEVFPDLSANTTSMWNGLYFCAQTGTLYASSITSDQGVAIGRYIPE